MTTANYSNFAIEQQPLPAAVYSDPAPGKPNIYENGSIVVRNLCKEDGDFAGRMLVEAFKSKFEWAAGKRNIPAVIEATSNDHKHLTEEEYARSYIALYEGRRAGVCVLKFSTSKNSPSQSDSYRNVSCCGLCGLMCMGCLTDESVSKGQCYLDHIGVDSSFRGKGVGKVLLEVADIEARKRGCRNIYLMVEASNRAKNLYERHGYVTVDREDGCLCAYCAVGMRYFYKMNKRL